MARKLLIRATVFLGGFGFVAGSVLFALAYFTVDIPDANAYVNSQATIIQKFHSMFATLYWQPKIKVFTQIKLFQLPESCAPSLTIYEVGRCRVVRQSHNNMQKRHF
jgi:hypothetical protein